MFGLVGPPNDQFALPALGHRHLPHILIGYFNSHSTWGYETTGNNGEAVEQWACDLTLIHDAKQPKSFNITRWKKSFNPDLIFESGNITNMCQSWTLSHTLNTARAVLVPTQSSYHKLHLSDDVITLWKQTGMDTQQNSINLLKMLNRFQAITSVL